MAGQSPEDQQRMMMAQALMRQQPATGAYGGMANAGGDIVGALLANKLANRANPDSINVTPQQIGGGIGGWLARQAPGLFGYGGD